MGVGDEAMMCALVASACGATACGMWQLLSHILWQTNFHIDRRGTVRDRGGNAAEEEREREGQAKCGKLNVNLIGALSRPSAYITGQQLIT